MTDDIDPAPHLRQLPDEDVERVVNIIRSNVPHMPYGLGLEIDAWAASRTVHDAKRCISTLLYAYGHEHLAREIEEILP
jgi:hypothetical protein